jgi:hypothetical protein
MVIRNEVCISWAADRGQVLILLGTSEWGCGADLRVVLGGVSCECDALGEWKFR